MRVRTGIVAAGLLLALQAGSGCWLLDDESCGGGVEIHGDPASFTLQPGPQDGGSWELEPPLTCDDGVTSLVMRAGGTRALDTTSSDALFADIKTQLQAQQIAAYGPGMTSVRCHAPSQPSPYLYFMQTTTWDGSTDLVRIIGRALAAHDIDGAVGVEVGVLIACAD